MPKKLPYKPWNRHLGSWKYQTRAVHQWAKFKQFVAAMPEDRLRFVPDAPEPEREVEIWDYTDPDCSVDLEKELQDYAIHPDEGESYYKHICWAEEAWDELWRLEERYADIILAKGDWQTMNTGWEGEELMKEIRVIPGAFYWSESTLVYQPRSRTVQMREVCSNLNKEACHVRGRIIKKIRVVGGKLSITFEDGVMLQISASQAGNGSGLGSSSCRCAELRIQKVLRGVTGGEFRGIEFGSSTIEYRSSRVPYSAHDYFVEEQETLLFSIKTAASECVVVCESKTKWCKDHEGFQLSLEYTTDHHLWQTPEPELRVRCNGRLSKYMGLRASKYF